MINNKKRYLLNQQLKAIKEELGESGSVKEIEELSRLALKEKWSNEVKDLFDKRVKEIKENESFNDRFFHSKLFFRINA